MFTTDINTIVSLKLYKKPKIPSNINFKLFLCKLSNLDKFTGNFKLKNKNITDIYKKTDYHSYYY